MKIAFVGKGGSGKSTAASLFIRHLIDHRQSVLAVDADINQHLAELVGAHFDPKMALSTLDNEAAIKQVLAGTNGAVDPDHMVKTTPPGKGSHIVHLWDDDEIIKRHTTSIADNGYFMHVGTYDDGGIGISCYHGNLAVLENIISHTDLTANEWLVTDMVAGTDTFAGALYLMFDAVCLVVEPTPESIGVYRQFIGLAQSSGVAERVHVIANKIEDHEDEAYIRSIVGDRLIGVLPYGANIKRSRQRGGRILFDDQLKAALAALYTRVKALPVDKNARLSELQALHKIYAAQDHVTSNHGELVGQIDAGYRYDGA